MRKEDKFMNDIIEFRNVRLFKFEVQLYFPVKVTIDICIHEKTFSVTFDLT